MHAKSMSCALAAADEGEVAEAVAGWKTDVKAVAFQADPCMAGVSSNVVTACSRNR